LDLEALVGRLVKEYAEVPLQGDPDPDASLRRDLGIESLSLVSLALRIGEALAVDQTAAGHELHRIDTVADLIAMCRATPFSPARGGSHGPR
jgi:acyl carrier protein